MNCELYVYNLFSQKEEIKGYGEFSDSDPVLNIMFKV